MSAIAASLVLLMLFIGGCCTFVIGLEIGAERERERIRNRIITDQATSAGDYSEAEEHADRMVRP